MSEADVSDDVKNEADPVTNPEKEKARADGWRPKEEWEGPEDQWVDYGEFNYRGELMGRISEQSNIIHNQKKQLDEVKQTINDLKAFQNKIAENEYNKIMKTLRAQKAQAIEDGEGQLVAEIEEQIDDLKETRAASEEKPTKTNSDVEPEMHPEVRAWLDNPANSWYNTDSVLRGAATAIAAEIAEDPSKSPGVVLREMTERIRKELPHKFRGGSAVSGGDQNSRPNGGGKKKRTLNDLEPFQQEVAKRFVRDGVMTADEYIEQLDALGE